MKYGYSTKVYDNGATIFGGVIEVKDDAESSFLTFSRYDLYFDVFPTKKQAENDLKLKREECYG